MQFINSPERSMNPGEAMALIRVAVEWAREHADIVSIVGELVKLLEAAGHHHLL